jgi:hypothetical protein
MDNYRELSLVDRLHALGQRPIDSGLQSAHLTSMTRVAPSSGPRLLPRLRVAALVVVGLLATSTGLAAAGVDGGPVTDPGEEIAAALGVDITDGKVTHGTDRHYGADCLPIADGKGAINRGQYLKWVRENRPDLLEAAMASDCGMPLSAVTSPDYTGPGSDGDDDSDPGR